MSFLSNRATVAGGRWPKCRDTVSGAKVGATAGVFLLPPVKAELGVPAVLALMDGVSLLGPVCTWTFLVEGHGRTLEEHHREDLP